MKGSSVVVEQSEKVTVKHQPSQTPPLTVLGIIPIPKEVQQVNYDESIARGMPAESHRNNLVAGGVRLWQQRVKQQIAKTGLSVDLKKKAPSSLAQVSEWQFTYNQDLAAVSTFHLPKAKKLASSKEASARHTSANFTKGGGAR
jgi:hypothetical protein